MSKSFSHRIFKHHVLVPRSLFLFPLFITRQLTLFYQVSLFLFHALPEPANVTILYNLHLFPLVAAVGQHIACTTNHADIGNDNYNHNCNSHHVKCYMRNRQSATTLHRLLSRWRRYYGNRERERKANIRKVPQILYGRNTFEDVLRP